MLCGAVIAACGGRREWGRAGTAPAADWPTKPVHVMVVYSAGGANDLLACVFSEPLGAALGQPFIVQNRIGGVPRLNSSATPTIPAPARPCGRPDLP